MRRFWIGLGAIALLSLTPAPSQAQLTLGPTLGMHDNGDFAIGATVGSPMDAVGEGVRILGEFLLFFPEVGSYFEISGNLAYDFPVADPTVLPFVIAGLNIGRFSIDAGSFGGGSSTDLGLNIGGGIAFDAGNVRPTVGGRFTVRDGGGFVFFATLPFAVGN